jgi:hypothetical protein
LKPRLLRRAEAPADAQTPGYGLPQIVGQVSIETRRPAIAAIDAARDGSRSAAPRAADLVAETKQPRCAAASANHACDSADLTAREAHVAHTISLGETRRPDVVERSTGNGKQCSASSPRDRTTRARARRARASVQQRACAVAAEPTRRSFHAKAALCREIRLRPIAKPRRCPLAALEFPRTFL